MPRVRKPPEPPAPLPKPTFRFVYDLTGCYCDCEHPFKCVRGPHGHLTSARISVVREPDDPPPNPE